MTNWATRVLWLSIGVVLVLLPALPIPAWVNAPDAGPNWSDHVTAWAIGLPVVLIGGLIAGRVTRGLNPRPIEWPRLPHGSMVCLLTIGLLTLSGFAMRDAFAGNPHLTDEVAQLFQARVFASGRLAAPAPALPEFFLIAQTTVTEAGWVSQYPPAQSALLAVGSLFSAEWLVNPVLGAIGVVLVYVVARGLFEPATAVVAAVLWAVSAWVLFMSATYMNHVAAVTFALAAWALVLGTREPRRWHFVAAGCCLASAAMARPLDALAAAAPLAVWLWIRRKGLASLWVVLGSVPLAALWCYLNWRQFGGPFTTGYALLYGAEQGLGFHMDPFGRQFTPLTALSNAAVAVRRLHIYLYEWPIPALLPLGVWALSVRTRSVSDLIVASGILAAPALYFFYWHSGFYPGPRFYYVAAPFLIIGSARAWTWTWNKVRGRQRWGIRWDASVATAAVIVLVWSWTSLVPSRWNAYKTQLSTLALNPHRELQDQNVSRALVLVAESWSSRIATKLWTLGAPPGLVERAFARVDACRLDQLARQPRDPSGVSPRLARDLEELIRTSRPPAQRVADWPDPALRLDPGHPLDDTCRTEMRRDLSGFTLYGHLAWRNPIGLDSGIIFARDRFQENEKLFDQYAGWPLWKYAPPADTPLGPPVLSGPRWVASRETP